MRSIFTCSVSRRNAPGDNAAWAFALAPPRGQTMRRVRRASHSTYSGSTVRGTRTLTFLHSRMNTPANHPFQIWVDADACPAPIKEILYRTARRLQVEL